MNKLRIESESGNIQHHEAIRELTAQNEALTNAFKVSLGILIIKNAQSLI